MQFRRLDNEYSEIDPETSGIGIFNHSSDHNIWYDVHPGNPYGIFSGSGNANAGRVIMTVSIDNEATISLSLMGEEGGGLLASTYIAMFLMPVLYSLIGKK